MSLSLSVLDLSPVVSGSTAVQALQNTLDLARRVDTLGFTRYWLAEHHSIPSIASSAPEIMIGHVAAVTTHMRIGSGGIMLPNHVPLKVVETFHMLEALHPGRIDLGIGRAPGSDQVTAYAFRRGKESLSGEDFPAQLAELLAFALNEFPDDHPFRHIIAVPAGVPLPPIWLLGSSGYSAQLAAEWSLGFAFAHHINPHNAVAAIQSYRQNFSSAAHAAHPQAILAVSVICAETDAEAELLASSMQLSWVRLRTGRPSPLPSPTEAMAYVYTPAEQELVRAHRAHRIAGSPATVRAQIDQLVEQTGADEVMVTTMVHDHAARVRSYELLAAAFELQAHGNTGV